MGSLGGIPLYVLEFGDELVYFSPYTITLFLLALTFTLLAIVSRPERQVDVAFGGDAYTTKIISVDEMRFRRFMAIACGLASMGAMVTGDVFNFTLFTAMVGITNVGIVAAVKSPHVQDAAYQYGLVALSATVPLFGAAALYAAATGSLSMIELAKGTLPAVPLVAKALLVIGVVGEGMAPFYAAKAEMFRAPGAPYVIMCSLSSLLIFLRVAEVVMIG
ncbi:MAG: hydrogenase subunit F [Methanoregula sp. PtaU1.Bin051]|nr:MAG: hydrogenase subunit F [Methanoregula sp. PtaU1.Bin051]